MYICVRNHGVIVGRGDTPEAAAEMADIIEAEHAEQAKHTQKENPVSRLRWRFNFETWKVEVVTE